jgi:uncharacterized membrane protein YvbJ
VGVATICEKCGAVYRRKKLRCIRCGEETREATEAEFAAFQVRVDRNLKMIGLSLAVLLAIITTVAIIRWLS